MSDKGDQDRRFFPRAEAPLEIKYSPGGGELTPVESKNISAGGISFKTGSAYKKGDILELNLRLKGLERTIHAVGKVLHSEDTGDGYETAVIFTDIPYTDFITVLDYSLAHLETGEG